jgi:hypothetical protein
MIRRVIRHKNTVLKLKLKTEKKLKERGWVQPGNLGLDPGLAGACLGCPSELSLSQARRVELFCRSPVFNLFFSFF